MDYETIAREEDAKSVRLIEQRLIERKQFKVPTKRHETQASPSHSLIFLCEFSNALFMTSVIEHQARKFTTYLDFEVETFVVGC